MAAARKEAGDDPDLKNLDELRVDAEMRQMELEALRETTRTCVRLINQFRLEANTSKALTEKEADERERRLKDVEIRYHDYRELYRDRLLQLAALNRKIAGESKVLGQAGGFVPATTRQEDRLDRLEDKLDRIIEALAGKVDR